MNKELKVLYIMGTARSGSTILEILLAHGKHCVGVGELTNIVHDGFINNKTCACGAVFHQCEFWSQVVMELALSDEEIEEWARVQHKIEWHSGFIRQLFHLILKPEMERYNTYNIRLLHAIQRVTGQSVIVDSSKYAGRALALSRLNGIELFVVCLTRSPEGLMVSFQKQNKGEQHPKKPWAVFRYYAFVMFSLRMGIMRMKNEVLVLQYEDLLSEATYKLGMVADFVGVDLDGVISTVENGEHFDVGHLVTANRLRKNKKVRFENKAKSENSTIQCVGLPILLMKLIGKCGWSHSR